MGKFFEKLLKASTIIAIAGAAGAVAYKAFKKHLESAPTEPNYDDENCECNKPNAPELDLNDEALKDLDE